MHKSLNKLLFITFFGLISFNNFVFAEINAFQTPLEMADEILRSQINNQNYLTDADLNKTWDIYFKMQSQVVNETLAYSADLINTEDREQLRQIYRFSYFSQTSPAVAAVSTNSLSTLMGDVPQALMTFNQLLFKVSRPSVRDKIANGIVQLINETKQKREQIAENLLEANLRSLQRIEAPTEIINSLQSAYRDRGDYTMTVNVEQILFHLLPERTVKQLSLQNRGQLFTQQQNEAMLAHLVQSNLDMLNKILAEAELTSQSKDFYRNRIMKSIDDLPLSVESRSRLKEKQTGILQVTSNKILKINRPTSIVNPARSASIRPQCRALLSLK